VNYGLRENNGANNPSTLTACTHQPPSWINMGFSADQYLLFWEFTYPLRWNQVLLQSLWTSYPTWMQMQQFLFHLLCKPHKQFCCRCPKSSINLVQLFLYTSTACSIIVQNWNSCLKLLNCFVEQLHQTTFPRIKRHFQSGICYENTCSSQIHIESAGNSYGTGSLCDVQHGNKPVRDLGFVWYTSQQEVTSNSCQIK